jgi:large subunit ribosomal protein L3
MGHRKKHAPKRGSVAFMPRARAKSLIARARYWPEIQEPTLLGFCGYKAGMTHAYVVEDDPSSPNYGKEIFCPVTVIESPPIFVCAIRAYKSTDNGRKAFTEAWTSNLPKDLNRNFTLPEKFNTEEALKKINENLDKIVELRAIICSTPRKANVPQKKPEIMEVAVGGKTVKEKFDFLKSILGKEINITNVLKEGQYIDVMSITKGKGFQGPVKRHGVRILQNKSNYTKRGVGCIGPWHPATIMYTVPRGGQMGFAQRIEYNKKILKIGVDGKDVTLKGGFLRYGVIRGPYIVVKGSVPGPAKRLIRIRWAVRGTNKIQPPKIAFFSLESQQGK